MLELLNKMDDEDKYHPLQKNVNKDIQNARRNSRPGESESPSQGIAAGGFQEWGERLRNRGIAGMLAESMEGVGAAEEGVGAAEEGVGAEGELGENASMQGSIGESCHPMILSQINNPRCNHLALLRIRNAASELRQAQLDLADFLDEQALLQQQVTEQMAEELAEVVARVAAELQRRTEPRGDWSGRAREAERRADQLAADNEALQEHIFDMEQRMVGVELEVDRRLKERGRQAERAAAASAREENKETIAQLQAEVASLRQKCNSLESRALPSELREKEYQLSEAAVQLAKREQSLREELTRLEARKEAAYQRQHQLLTGEENLTRKISEMRKKEAELSEWEAQLTRKTRAVRTIREVAAHSQLAEDPSREDLNRSGEISLKSFGRHNKDDELRIATTSLEQLGIARRRTLNNEEEPQSPRDPLEFIRERRQARQNGESAYQLRQGIIEQGRRFNAHVSSHQSREASPYRALQELKGKGANQASHSHQYVLPVASPRERQRDHSKNSGRSVSRSRAARREQSGLGSKLQRLREQIKKQIESIK